MVPWPRCLALSGWANWQAHKRPSRRPQSRPLPFAALSIVPPLLNPPFTHHRRLSLLLLFLHPLLSHINTLIIHLSSARSPTASPVRSLLVTIPSTPESVDHLVDLSPCSNLPPFPASLSPVDKITSHNITSSFLNQLLVLVREHQQLLSSSTAAPAAPVTPSYFGNSSTTDPSAWLPSPPNPSQPATPSHQPPVPSFPQQDFLLFEAPPQPAHNTASVSPPLAFTGPHRRPSSQVSSVSPPLQNQRVAALQAVGHSTTPPGFTNRFSPAQSAKYPYASPQQPPHPRQRPQVPLFHQSPGTIAQSAVQTSTQKMAADMDLFGESFDYSMGTGAHESFSSAYSSPAVPTVYDASAHSSASSTNTGTVSPKDVFRDPMSAPNSSALTNLTSPSVYNESPAMPDSYEVSPMFNDVSDFDQPVNDSWYSLFPDAQPTAEHSAEDVALPKRADIEAEELNRSSQRKRSSASPTTQKAGVEKSRKRDRPLPPIIVDDPSDVVALKRARNTLAARKSRDRKVQRTMELEEEIDRLKKERDHWKSLALARSTGQN